MFGISHTYFIEYENKIEMLVIHLWNMEMLWATYWLNLWICILGTLDVDFEGWALFNI